MLKLSEIEEIFADYDRAKWSPSRMAVHLGCDCGCGGDSYTIEQWDAEEDEAERSIEAMKKFCEENNIIYDGIE